MSEFDLFHIETIVENNRKLRIDLEHAQGTIQAQASKIKELKSDNELLYIDNQNHLERIKRLEKDITILLATAAAKPL